MMYDPNLDKEKALRNNAFMGRILSQTNQINDYLRGGGIYGQGNNYHNQLKERAHQPQHSSSVSKNPFLNIGGNQYKEYAAPTLNNPEGSFWDRIYALTNEAMTRKANSSNVRLHNNLMQEQAMMNRQQQQFNRQQALKERELNFSNQLQKDRYNRGIFENDRDFNYQTNRDYVNDIYNNLKLQQEQDYKRQVLEKDRGNVFYKNIANDLYSDSDINDYETRKQIADYFIENGQLPPKNNGGGYDFNKTGQNQSIDFSKLRDVDYVNELQSQGYKFVQDENGRRGLQDRNGEILWH